MMEALVEAEDKLKTTPGIQEEEEVVDSKDFKFFVYFCGGEIVEVAPATELRVTSTDMLFLLEGLEVARMSREKIYFAARERIPIPVLF
jgi:hypothetical protein